MVDEDLPEAVREYLREKGKRLGTEYGALGGEATARKLSAAQRKRNAARAGKANLEALTPEERSERARNAALAMHAKKRAAAKKKTLKSK